MRIFGRGAAKADELELERTRRTFEEFGRQTLEGVIPIADVTWRSRAKVAGRVKALRVQPWAEQVASLELTLADSTGGITVVFLGRRKLAGIELGTHLMIEGVTSEHHGMLTVLNPAYQLLPNRVALPY